MRIQGVVTVVNGSFGFLIVQDETGGIEVQPSHAVESSLVGHRIEVSGTSEPGARIDTISDAAVRDLGAAALPKPVLINAKELRDNTFDGKRVMVLGTARVGRVDASGQLVLPLAVGGLEVSVCFMSDKGLEVEELVDADIRVTGVASTAVDIDGKLTDLTILAPDPAAVQIERRAHEPASLAEQSLAKVMATKGQTWEHRLRFQGRIEKMGENGGVQFRDSSGRVAISSVAGLDTRQTGAVDIVAFVDRKNSGWTLADARLTLKTPPLAKSGNSPAAITSIAELHALDPERAALGVFRG